MGRDVISVKFTEGINLSSTDGLRKALRQAPLLKLGRNVIAALKLLNRHSQILYHFFTSTFSRPRHHGLNLKVCFSQTQPDVILGVLPIVPKILYQQPTLPCDPFAPY